MDFDKYIIGENQIREFALSIFADIDDYIQTHEQEFQEFLKNERMEVKKC